VTAQIILIHHHGRHYGTGTTRQRQDDARDQSGQAKGFEVIPRRWVVERTIAWICRRLAKDYENLNRTAFAFIRLASIRLMLRRITRYCYPSRIFRTDSETCVTNF
jgi:transposase